MSKEIDHRYTEEVVCPYCGYEFGDSWDLDDDGTIECDSRECGKEFKFERNIEVTYCTFKLKELEVPKETE